MKGVEKSSNAIYILGYRGSEESIIFIRFLKYYSFFITSDHGKFEHPEYSTACTHKIRRHTIAETREGFQRVEMRFPDIT